MPRITTYGKKEELSEAPQVEELLKNLEFHKAIQRVTGLITNASGIQDIIVDIKEDIRKLFNIHILNIYLIDKEKKEIFTLKDENNQVRESRLPIDYTTFAGYVAQKKKILHIADAYNTREIKKIHSSLSFDDSLDELTGLTTGQIFVSPIMHEGVVLGVMEIMNIKGGKTIDDYNQIFLDEIEVCLARTLFRHLDFSAASQKHTVKFHSLLRDNLITADELKKAVKEAFETGKETATVLMEHYHISKRAIGSALSDHFGCPFTAYSDNLSVTKKLLKGLDKANLVDGLWIPLKTIKGKMHILIDDPWNPKKRREIEDFFETDFIQYEVALASDILKLIDRSYEDLDRQPEENGRPVHPTADTPLTELSPEADLPAKKTETEPLVDHVVSKPDTILPVQEYSQKQPAALSSSVAMHTQDTNVKPVMTVSAESSIAKSPEKSQFPDEPSSRIFQKPEPQEEISVVQEGNIFAPLAEIIFAAIGRQASHIHFEPNKANRKVAVRLRVDGQFITHPFVALEDYEKLIVEVKKFFYHDSNKPSFLQEGRMQIIRPSGENIGLKISLIPTHTGLEDAVFRLSRKPKFLPLELLGLSEGSYGELSNILHQPRGVVLIVGPAGQGITTTLHACLDHISTPEKKIWTAEESITITQEGLRQVAVDPSEGRDFRNVLHLLSTADPDVIMLSSIDDLKTAEPFMNASLKGRLMLGTLRAETIVETLEKCFDMGVDRLVFADAMLSIMEQRLIKTLCPVCKEKYRPGREEYDDLVQLYGKEAFDKLNGPYTGSLNFFRPRGCDACGETGYQGRMCVSEIFIFTPRIKRMIRRGESPESLYQTGMAGGITTLLQEGLIKVLEGYSDFRHVRLTCLK